MDAGDSSLDVSEVVFAEKVPEGSVQFLVRGETAALPLKGVIDLAAESARLQKELAKADADIQRVDQKLDNPKFVANAAEEVVEAEPGPWRPELLLEARELRRKLGSGE